MAQKITKATSRAYRKLYGPAARQFKRRVGAWMTKNNDKLADGFWRIYRPTVKKSAFPVQKKKSKDQEWIEYVTGDLNGDIALDPVVVSFAELSAEQVLAALGEEALAATMFDSGAVTVSYMRKNGLHLAKHLSTSLGDKLKSTLATGLENNEPPAVLKERLRASTTQYKGWELTRLARTESMGAVNEGALEALKASPSIDAKQWIAHSGACVACQGLDGEVVLLDASFSTGVQRPPKHPNCRCTIGGVRKKK